MSDLAAATRSLARAIRRTAQSAGVEVVAPPGPESIERLSAGAFRAVVAERLRGLEREIGEVRVRINGLLFVVAGAVITQVVIRLFV